MSRSQTALIVSSLLAFYTAASAENDSTIFEDIDISVGTGIVKLDASEIVWDNDLGGASQNELLSLLEWETHYAPVLTFGLGTQLPWDIDASLNGALGVGGDSYMVDYDWLMYSSTEDDSWSDRSMHPDTRLRSYIKIDFELAKSIQTGIDGLAVEPVVGLLYESADWGEYGGSYIYSTDGFRDDVGEFESDKLGISYRLSYLSPYMGARMTHSIDAFTFTASGKVGVSVDASAFDNHRDREITFSEEIDRTTFVGLGLSASYAISDKLSVQSSFVYNQYSREVSDVTIRHAGERFVDKNGGGAELSTTAISLGLVYNF